jgi:hypothetical protein
MLEYPELLLHPWRWETRSPHQRPVQVRRVVDAGTHQPLGLVRAVNPLVWPMFRWLARRAWQVLETEDESLLLTISAPWGLIRPWQVHDAEERLVCSIHAGVIYDNSGCCRARASGGPGTIRLLDKAKMELAVAAFTSHGLELRFAPRIDADPYAKMSILGAALSLEEKL